MRRIAGLMIVVAALLLSQARWDPLDFGPSPTEAQLSQGEHPPVLRETKSATAREARSKQAQWGSGDMLAAECLAPPPPSATRSGNGLPASQEPRPIAAGGFHSRAPPAGLTSQGNDFHA